MAKLEEVISSYNWFAPFCECTHSEGTFKGLKMLRCKSAQCLKACSPGRLREHFRTSEEAQEETFNSE